VNRNKRINIPDRGRIRHDVDAFRRARHRTLVLRTALGTAGVAVIVVASLLATRGSGPKPVQPVSTVDANSRVCVLTDANDPSLTTVDSGLHQAATANGHVNIQTYTIPAAVTDPGPYLNSLIQQKCGLIVAVGALAAGAAANYADDGQKAAARFIVVGTEPPGIPGITVVPPAKLTADGLAGAVSADLP
jgi:hypothetical protein